jgi:cell division protein FtsB
MNVNLGIWDKLFKLVAFLLLLLVLAAASFAFYQFYFPLIQQNQRYRKELLLLDARIAENEKFRGQLKASIDSLQNDPRAVERLAREKLSLAKTNEMVVRFEPVVDRNASRR